MKPPFFFCLFFVASCATSPLDSSSETPLPDEFQIVVYGLSCPLCSSNLYDVLNAVPGVEESWGDLDSGTVHLRLDGTATVTPAHIERAVGDAGFTLHAVQIP